MRCDYCKITELEERDWFRTRDFEGVEVVCKSLFCSKCDRYCMDKEQERIYRDVMNKMINDCLERNKNMKRVELKH